MLHRRLWLLQAISILPLTVLVWRLWELQVLAGGRYGALAKADFVRTVVIRGLRH